MTINNTHALLEKQDVPVHVTGEDLHGITIVRILPVYPDVREG
jgi:hypothetical protein